MSRPLPNLPGKPGAKRVARSRQAAGVAVGKVQGAAGAVQQGLQRVLPGGGLPGRGRDGLGAGVGVQVQLAPCAPPDFGGLTLEYSAGGGYNATASIGIAFAPRDFVGGRTVRDRWQFDGLTLQLGGGGGIDASINIEYCHVKALMPGDAAQGG